MLIEVRAGGKTKERILSVREKQRCKIPFEGKKKCFGERKKRKGFLFENKLWEK